MAVIFKVIFVLSIVLLKEEVAKYLILISLIQGLSEALYWSSFNTMRNEIVPEGFFQKYLSINSIVEKTIGIVFPLILGTMIDVYSFSTIAMFILFLALIQLTFTLFIENKRQVKGIYSLKNFYKDLSEKKDGKLLKKMQFNYFLSGLKNSTGTVYVLLIALTFSSNTQLGMFSSLFAVLTLLILILFSIFYDVKRHRFFIWFSGIIAVTTACAMFFGISPTTMLIYNAGSYIASVVPNLVNDIRRNTIIKKLKLKNYIPENMGITELLLNAGRVVSYGLIFLVTLIGEVFYFQILIVVLETFMLIFTLSVAHLEKQLENTFGESGIKLLTFTFDEKKN